MPLVPDQPFPKTPGNPIMAKDWNDAVTEVVRLDTAKVNRAGDAISGPLTIAAALAVGSAAAPPAGVRLHVVDTANPAVVRVQSQASFGAARLELWSDPRGGPNEWRPGYIESFDTGGYTGGLKFVTNGTGAANKQGSAEQLRLWNGMAGFGVTDPGFRIDALGRIRVRQPAGGATSGIFFHQAVPNANRAFVGMADDNNVGFWGETGAGWGFRMDTTTGNLWQLSKSAPAVFRLQSNAAFGPARLELWSDPPGSAGEWRPGYVESFDNGNFTGGLKFVTNGTGSGNKQGSAEQMRLVNGAAGVGVTDPGFRLDVGGRSRFRDGGGTAGLWFYHSGAPAPQDRAFVGMAGDSEVGFWGNTGANWGLRMNTQTGNVGIRTSPDADALSVGGNIQVSGRVWANNFKLEAAAGGQVAVGPGGAYSAIPNMSVTFTLGATRPVWIFFHLPGVQMHRQSGGDPPHSGAYFRIVIDSTEVCSTRQEWNNNGWELRSVVLTRLWTLTAGTHTVRADWWAASGDTTLTGCWYSEVRTLQVFEL